MPLCDLWENPASDDPNNALLTLRRRAQTEAARCASQLKRQKDRTEQQPMPETTFTKKGFTAHDRANMHSMFQSAWYTKRVHAATDSFDDKKTEGRQRARAVWCYFVAVVAGIKKLFEPAGDGAFKHVQHIVATNIVDDTNMKIGGEQEPSAVATVMNNLQTINVKFSDPSHGTVCFQIHQPLMCLENGKAGTMWFAFTSWLLTSSKGVGRHFVKLGLSEDFLHRVPWVATVMIGDALRANDSVFRVEREQLHREFRESPNRNSRKIGLQFRCGIHKLALIRKPIILSFTNMWSMVVRCAHLFESMSFRSRFRVAMASVIASSFRRVVLAQGQLPPPEFSQWKKRTMDVLSYEDCGEGCNQDTVLRYLHYCNSDTTKDELVHYCFGCCDSDQECLYKIIEVHFKFFAKGYPPPLFYRFKGYERAKQFIIQGQSLFRILPRTFNKLAEKNQPGRDNLFSAEIHDLLLALDSEAGNDNAFIDSIEDAVNSLLDRDNSYADINKKRQRLTREALADPEFTNNLMMLDILTTPLDRSINHLLGRTKKLNELQLMLRLDSGTADDHSTSIVEPLKRDCRDTFLQYVSGGFAEKMVRSFTQVLVRDFYRCCKRFAANTGQLTESVQACGVCVCRLLASLWPHIYVLPGDHVQFSWH
jgi:hypothetical protein